MIHNIKGIWRFCSHNIYSVKNLNYHHILNWLNRQDSLFSLFVLLGESILIFLTITMILIIGMGWG